MDKSRGLRPIQDLANLWREERGEEKSKFGNPAKLIFAGYLVSAIGSGMVYPYLAVYVQQVRALGEIGAASALAILALGTVAGSLTAGFSADWIGPRWVGATGILFQGIGYAFVGLADIESAIFLACAVTGVGSGLFLAVLSPTINLICPREQHRRAFSMRYLINNLGIGVGAVIAAVVLNVPDSARFEVLYEINGGSYAVFLVFFCWALRWTSVPKRRRAKVAPKRLVFQWRRVGVSRQFGLLLVVQTLLVAAGFSQMQSVVPLFLRDQLGASTTLIGIVLIVNCLGIVLIQPFVTRLGIHISETRMLSSVGGIWAFAFAMGIASSVGGSWGTVAVMMFCGFFTFGECFYGPSFQTLLVRAAPQDRLGNYSGISSSLWGATTFIAPPLGVLVVDSRWPYLLWALCAMACAIASMCALKIISGPDGVGGHAPAG
jgi:MFS family permease